MEIRGIQVIEVKTVIKKKKIKIETIKRIRSSRKIIGIVINHRERERERGRERLTLSLVAESLALDTMAALV